MQRDRKWRWQQSRARWILRRTGDNKPNRGQEMPVSNNLNHYRNSISRVCCRSGSGRGALVLANHIGTRTCCPNGASTTVCVCVFARKVCLLSRAKQLSSISRAPSFCARTREIWNIVYQLKDTSLGTSTTHSSNGIFVHPQSYKRMTGRHSSSTHRNRGSSYLLLGI